VDISKDGLRRFPMMPRVVMTASQFRRLPLYYYWEQVLPDYGYSRVWHIDDYLPSLFPSALSLS
jgi:hypothetical protein